MLKIHFPNVYASSTHKTNQKPKVTEKSSGTNICASKSIERVCG